MIIYHKVCSVFNRRARKLSWWMCGADTPKYLPNPINILPNSTIVLPAGGYGYGDHPDPAYIYYPPPPSTLLIIQMTPCNDDVEDVLETKKLTLVSKAN